MQYALLYEIRNLLDQQKWKILVLLLKKSQAELKMRNQANKASCYKHGVMFYRYLILFN